MKRLHLAVLIIALFGSTAAGFWVTSVTTVTIYPTKDSYGWQFPSRANNGGSNNFQVESYNEKPGNMRGWVAFNISAIPPNAWLITAKLHLRVWHKTTADAEHNTGDTTGRIYGVYRLLQDWGEYNISWAYQPNFTDVHHSESPVPPGQGAWNRTEPALWMEWDTTDIVNDWRSGIPNYGVVVKDLNENSPIVYSTQFFTHDNVPNQSYFPRLIVTYTSPQAVESLVVLLVAETIIILGVWWTRVKRSHKPTAK